jgi:hypothetical protein
MQVMNLLKLPNEVKGFLANLEDLERFQVGCKETSKWQVCFVNQRSLTQFLILLGVWYKVLYMEVDMELSKKTTILFPPDLHERLSRLAAQKGVSLGELVRSACERQYGIVSREDRLAAVRSLAALEPPLGDTARMKLESVSDPEDLLC